MPCPFIERMVSGVTFSPAIRSPLFFKTRDQFLDGYCRSSYLAHHNACRMIGDHGRLSRGCACGYGDGEARDYRVAGARYIENFLSDSGNVKRTLATLTKEHSEFAKSNQQQGRFECV